MSELTHVFLPYRGEFGHKIMWHVPWVHAQEGPKIVYHEPGEECLFPSADEHRIVVRKTDVKRFEWLKYDAEYVGSVSEEHRQGCTREQLEQTRFRPPLDKHPDGSEPLQRFIPTPTTLAGIDCDVVVCPRKRDGEYVNKNWPHWPELVCRLKDHWRVFAAGAPDSSTVVACDTAWECHRYLDATIEAMLAAKVVVATDAGLAHLAVLCGRPLLLITDGHWHTAPGYRAINLARYHEANHQGTSIRPLMNTWNDLDPIIEAVTNWTRLRKPLI